MESPSFRFRQKEHLKKRDEIRRVFKQGKNAACYGAKLFVIANGLPHNRIAFTFARKFGTAVARNRARRLGREAYRRLRPVLEPGYDVVMLLYPGEDTLAARQKQVDILFDRAGLMIRPPAPREHTGHGKGENECGR